MWLRFVWSSDFNMHTLLMFCKSRSCAVCTLICQSSLSRSSLCLHTYCFASVIQFHPRFNFLLCCFLIVDWIFFAYFQNLWIYPQFEQHVTSGNVSSSILWSVCVDCSFYIIKCTVRNNDVRQQFPVQVTGGNVSVKYPVINYSGNCLSNAVHMH